MNNLNYPKHFFEKSLQERNWMFVILIWPEEVIVSTTGKNPIVGSLYDSDIIVCDILELTRNL